MSRRLLELVLERARCARGQTTVEWIALMVGLGALITVIAGDDVWHKAGQVVVDAVNAILGTNGDRV